MARDYLRYLKRKLAKYSAEDIEIGKTADFHIARAGKSIRDIKDELLGMGDTISDEGMLVDVTKTELEKRLGGLEKENRILKEKPDHLESSMKKIGDLVGIVKKLAGRMASDQSEDGKEGKVYI